MAQNDNYIGLAMGLDVTDLKSGLSETKKEINTARKEFNATTSGMDDWTKSSEGLNAKLKQLNKTFEMQEKNVNGIQAELDRAKERYGENSEQVRRLNDRLLDAKASIGKTEKEQRKYSRMLEEVESNTEDTEQATRGLERSLKKTDKATSDLKGGFSVLKGAMANLVSSGIKGAISGLKGIVDESREFRREMAYLNETAKATGSDFDNVKDKLSDVASITEDTGAGVEGLNNLMSAGFDGDALNQVADELLGASIKWKDTLKFEGLSDGLQETLAVGKATGPFVELLERAGLNAEKFDKGLSKANTQAEKQQYILDTLSKLGLKDIKDGYVESNKALVDGAKANFEYAEKMAVIGEKAEPTFTTIKNGFADVLSALFKAGNGMDSADLNGKISDAFKWFIDVCVPFIKTSVTWIIDHFKAIAVVVGIVGGAFAVWKVAKIVGGVVKGIRSLATAMSFLNLQVLKNSLAWVTNGASMVANKISMLASAGATSIATGAQALLNTTVLGFPLVWILGAIAAVIAVFVLMWKNWDKISAWLKKSWEALKKAFEKIWGVITGFFTGAWDKIKAVWGKVIDFFKGIWKSIKTAFSSVGTFFKDTFKKGLDGVKSVWNTVITFYKGIWDKIKKVFSSVGTFFKSAFKKGFDGIKSAFGNVKSFFTGILDKIIEVFSGLKDTMKDIGQRMMDGLIDGVKSMVDKVKNAVTDVVDSAVNGLKNFLGIHSPSRLMRDQVGKMMGLGVGDGILGSTGTVLKDAKQFANNISTGLTSNLNAMNGALGVQAKSGLLARQNAITNNYTQIINAPKQPSRLELYRQTKNLLALRGSGN